MRHDIKTEEKQINLSGDLSVRRLAEIKEMLLSELFDSQRLCITITQVSTLHLFTLQWIYAFGCAANSEGKEVIITLDLPAKFDLLVKASGIKKMFNRFGNRRIIG